MKKHVVIAAFAIAAVGAACGAAEESGSDQPTLEITSPAEGATVAAPVTVAVTTTGITIEPAGDIKAGTGHVHIMIDTACVTAGEVIPKDDTHVHLGDGSSSIDLELEAGEHTICVQMADGAHTALDVTATRTFTVE